MITKKLDDVSLPTELIKLAYLFHYNDHFANTLFAVGGYPRDILLGKKPYDIDIASATKLDDVEKILANSEFKFEVKNKKMGTAIISCNNLKFEYTCFRKETYANTGKHNPVKVEFTESVLEDAMRRDFYCNALYLNILTLTIYDPLEKGLSDIEHRKLTLIESQPHKFVEDATRIIRMVKFKFLLDFEIDYKTLKDAILFSFYEQNISRARLEKELDFIKLFDIDKKREIYKLLNDIGIEI